MADKKGASKSNRKINISEQEPSARATESETTRRRLPYFRSGPRVHSVFGFTI